MSKFRWVLAGVALTVIACGGGDLPAKQLADSEAAIRSADELHANQVPRAALHLTLAKEQMGKAQQLIKNGENVRARNLLVRASADAELALALAQGEQATRDAQQASDKVQRLQHDNPATPTEGK